MHGDGYEDIRAFLLGCLVALAMLVIFLVIQKIC